MLSPSEVRRIARQVSLFAKISEEDVAKILAKGMTMQIRKGSAVFYEKSTGNTMYVILSGKIELFEKKRHLATLGTGEMFGEMALISDEPRSATAIAGEDSTLFVLTETTFDELMTKRVAIRMLLNIIATLSKRLREANRRLMQQMAETNPDSSQTT